MVAIVALHAFSGFALAADEVPVLGNSLMALFSALKDKATAAVIVVCVFQVLRTNEVVGVLGKLGLQGRGLQIAIAIITALGYVADAWARGANLLQAAIEGLFTAGGGMLIFNAFKDTVDSTKV